MLTWPVTSTGGVNEAAFGVAHALKEMGFHPIIGIATWSSERHPPVWRGIEIVNLRLRDVGGMDVGLKSVLAYSLAAVRDAFALLRFVRQRDIRVINFQFASLAAWIPALLRLLKLLPAKIVLTFQGNDFVEMSRTEGFRRKAWNFVLRHSDGLTACSGALGDNVMRFLPGTRVITVHNGVDHRLFSVTRAQRRRRPLLLQVAKFEHKKAQDVTLRAFRDLLDTGLDADLALVGATGPELEMVRALIVTLNLSDRVRIDLDVPHEQIPQIMAEADLFLLPSRVEPFGIVLLEAGAVGLPVIAARVGGIPELLKDGETAVLVEPDDPTALAEAIRRLLADPSTAIRLASSWHDQVGKRWSWTESARGYLAAAREPISGPQTDNRQTTS